LLHVLFHFIPDILGVEGGNKTHDLLLSYTGAVAVMT